MSSPDFLSCPKWLVEKVRRRMNLCAHLLEDTVFQWLVPMCVETQNNQTFSADSSRLQPQMWPSPVLQLFSIGQQFSDNGSLLKSDSRCFPVFVVLPDMQEKTTKSRNCLHTCYLLGRQQSGSSVGSCVCLSFVWRRNFAKSCVLCDQEHKLLTERLLSRYRWQFCSSHAVGPTAALAMDTWHELGVGQAE